MEENAEAAQEERKKFSFYRRLSTVDPGNISDLSRSARALEYIASYLDRIETHLERIANAAEGGEPLNPDLAKAYRQRKVGGKGTY